MKLKAFIQFAWNLDACHFLRMPTSNLKCLIVNYESQSLYVPVYIQKCFAETDFQIMPKEFSSKSIYTCLTKIINNYLFLISWIFFWFPSLQILYFSLQIVHQSINAFESSFKCTKISHRCFSDQGTAEIQNVPRLKKGILIKLKITTFSHNNLKTALWYIRGMGLNMYLNLPRRCCTTWTWQTTLGPPWSLQ